jgi:hypothetical protein
MSRHPFGWSYPPGAANDPYAPYNEVEGPCQCCGKAVNDCICPECSTCGEVGNPECYAKHNMVPTAEQRASLMDFQQRQEAAAAAEEKMWAEWDGNHNEQV